jgi:hypothetical protein
MKRDTRKPSGGRRSAAGGPTPAGRTRRSRRAEHGRSRALRARVRRRAPGRTNEPHRGDPRKVLKLKRAAGGVGPVPICGARATPQQNPSLRYQKP